MFNESAKNLQDLSEDDVRHWLGTKDTIFCDCDGVLWEYYNGQALPGAPAVINKLKATGKQLYFVTNNATKTRQELFERARQLGFDIQLEDMLAPGQRITEYLKNLNFKKKAYIIGSSGIANELSAVGIENFGVGPDNGSSCPPPAEVGAVIVGFDEHFNYAKILKACQYLDDPDCLFLTTNVDPVHKYPQYHVPGTGAILKAVETCAERAAEQFGKPHPKICHNLPIIPVPERTLMIGDCCKIDVVFGKNCNFQTLIVGTGSYNHNVIEEMMKNLDENKQFIPDAYLPSLGDLMQYL